MNNNQFSILLHFLKALADESRLKILGILVSQECSVEELATLLNLKEPTVSHHLAKLKKLDLVDMEAEGNVHLYRINLEVFESFTQGIFTPENMANLVQDIKTDVWEMKVLNAAIDGNFQSPDSQTRLREIPVNRKKRLVILKWLMCQFEVGVKYTEVQVDEIIQKFYHDFAKLRHELLESKLILKTNGTYTRSLITHSPPMEVEKENGEG